MTQHIGRRVNIGIWLESTAWTAVAADYWLPETTGKMLPVVERVVDDRAFGNIHERRDSEIAKTMTEMSIEGIVTGESFGLLLHAALWAQNTWLYLALTSWSGTFTVGETVTWWTSSATWVVVRTNSTSYMVVKVTSWTFTAWGETITWWSSGATASASYDSALRCHVFEVDATSNNHPALTLWEKTPVASYKAAYGMVSELNISSESGDWVKFNASFMAKTRASDTATPSYSTEKYFRARDVDVYLSDTEAWLNSATATKINNFSLTITKSVRDYQALWDVDVDALYNQSFSVAWDFEALFDAATLQGLFTAGTKKYMRIAIINTSETIGSASNPSLVFNFGQVDLDERDRSDANNDLVTQTLWFKWEYETTSGYMLKVDLLNTKTDDY